MMKLVKLLIVVFIFSVLPSCSKTDLEVSEEVNVSSSELTELHGSVIEIEKNSVLFIQEKNRIDHSISRREVKTELMYLLPDGSYKEIVYEKNGEKYSGVKWNPKNLYQKGNYIFIYFDKDETIDGNNFCYLCRDNSYYLDPANDALVAINKSTGKLVNIDLNQGNAPTFTKNLTNDVVTNFNNLKMNYAGESFTNYEINEVEVSYSGDSFYFKDGNLIIEARITEDSVEYEEFVDLEKIDQLHRVFYFDTYSGIIFYSDSSGNKSAYSPKFGVKKLDGYESGYMFFRLPNGIVFSRKEMQDSNKVVRLDELGNEVVMEYKNEISDLLIFDMYLYTKISKTEVIMGRPSEWTSSPRPEGIMRFSENSIEITRDSDEIKVLSDAVRYRDNILGYRDKQLYKIDLANNNEIEVIFTKDDIEKITDIFIDYDGKLAVVVLDNYLKESTYVSTDFINFKIASDTVGSSWLPFIYISE